MTETTLARIQTDPASGRATAFFETKTTVEGRTFLDPNWQPVEWDLTATDKTVTVGDVTLTDAQVSAFVTALAYRAKAEAEAAAAATLAAAEQP